MNLADEDRDPIGDAIRAQLADPDPALQAATSDEDAADEGTTGDADGSNGAVDTSASAGDDEQDPNDGAGTTADAETGGRPGYDSMLEAITNEFGEDGADAFKDLQRRTTRAEQRASEVEDLKGEVEDMLATIDERAPAPQEGEPEEQTGYQELVSQISDPDQREFFQQLLDAKLRDEGFVKRDELDTERQNESVQRVSTEANRAGVEAFGERFGEMDNGTFRPNAEYVERARPTLERLTDQGALTHGDLFKLAYFDDLVKEARADGRKAALSERNEQVGGSVRRAKRATVASRPGGGTGDAPLYDRNDPKQVGNIMAATQRIRERLNQI